MISTVVWIKSVPDFQGSPEPASQVSFSQQSSLAKPAECHGATGFGAMMCHGTWECWGKLPNPMVYHCCHWISTCMSVYVYIYIEKESVCVCLCVSIELPFGECTPHFQTHWWWASKLARGFFWIAPPRRFSPLGKRALRFDHCVFGLQVKSWTGPRS